MVRVHVCLCACVCLVSLLASGILKNCVFSGEQMKICDCGCTVLVPSYFLSLLLQLYLHRLAEDVDAWRMNKTHWSTLTHQYMSSVNTKWYLACWEAR